MRGCHLAKIHQHFSAIVLLSPQAIRSHRQWGRNCSHKLRTAGHVWSGIRVRVYPILQSFLGLSHEALCKAAAEKSSESRCALSWSGRLPR